MQLNPILARALLAWLLAQAAKFVLAVATKKKFDPRRLIQAGGMPSSHSALVSALTTGIGRSEGFASNSFTVALIFSLIVMYDAAGVRYAVGKQARILNQIMDEFYHSRKFSEKRLIELLGHTPYEVIIGMLLGILIASL